MKGNNTLVLNHSTMIEALQLWVDAKFCNPVPIVKTVKMNKVGLSEAFDVEIEEAPTKP